MLRRTTLLPAIAAVLVLGLSGCAGTDDGPDAREPSASDQVVELVAEPLPAGARCGVANAETLAAKDLAFEGTVTRVQEGRATLDVSRWFAGGSGDTVVVASPSRELQDLLLAVRFEEGRSYLVSASEGAVSLCGYSAESTPELEALFEEAFPAAG